MSAIVISALIIVLLLFAVFALFALSLPPFNQDYDFQDPRGVGYKNFDFGRLSRDVPDPRVSGLYCSLQPGLCATNSEEAAKYNVSDIPPYC